MRIDQPYYFFLLLLLPVAVWVFFRFMDWRKAAVNKWADADLFEKQIPGFSYQVPKVKFILVAGALLFVILAIVNFQFHFSDRNKKQQGVDVALVIDVSSSMLAKDAPPNRLTEAKRIASQILSGSRDNRVALIAFAGTAITMVPLTPDHSSVEMMLEAISTNTIPQQGSDVGEAIKQAMRALPNNQNHYKAMVLISDGEDHEEKIPDAVKLAAQNGIAIFSVGIGTAQGGEIPINEKPGSVEMKRDAGGKPVITKLESGALKEIAKRTGGIYLQPEGNFKQAAALVLKQIAAIGNNTYEEKQLSGYESAFQYFLFPALLLLIVEFLLRSRKRITL